MSSEKSAKLKYDWRDVPGFVAERGRQDRPWMHVPMLASRFKYQKMLEETFSQPSEDEGSGSESE